MTKDELLALSATDVRAVDFGDGRTVYVRSLSVADTETVQQLSKAGVPALAGWVLLSACDQAGVRLFADGDADAVSRLPAKYVKRICDAALALNEFASNELDADAKN